MHKNREAIDQQQRAAMQRARAEKRIINLVIFVIMVIIILVASKLDGRI